MAIGHDSAISLWFNTWIVKEPISEGSPLPNLSFSKDESASTLISNGNWSLSALAHLPSVKSRDGSLTCTSFIYLILLEDAPLRWVKSHLLCLKHIVGKNALR